MKEIWNSMAITDRVWCVGNFIGAGGSLAVLILVILEVLPLASPVLMLALIFPLTLYFGLRSLWEAMNAIRLKVEGRICRGCDKRKLNMALEYGEDEGLCRECLDEYLPLALKAGVIKKKEVMNYD